MFAKRIFQAVLMLILFCLSMPIATSFAQVQESWVQRYDGPEQLGANAVGLAINTGGSVYVAGTVHGSANADIVVIKYGASGNVIWKRQYDRGTGEDEEAKSLSIDAAGNIYILAYIGPPDGCSDFLILKYNSSGVRQWVRRHDGSCNDVLRGMKADAAGNVYFWYQSWLEDISQFNTGIQKYDTAGTLRWGTMVPRVAGCSYESADVSDLVVDPSGNIYVTGYHSARECDEFPYARCHTFLSCRNYLTCKYNADGQLQWARSYNGGETGYSSYAHGVAVDAAGNVYVTGTSRGDVATVKYSPAGDELWVQRFDRGGDDGGDDIGIDADGKVCVAGWSSGEAAIIKYDADGNQEWASFFSGGGAGGGLVIDGERNLYVATGTYDADTGYDYLTVKYDALGNAEWTIRYNNSAFNGNEVTAGIAVHTDGSVYVTGNSEKAAGLSEWATVKYVQTGGGTALVFNPTHDAYVKSSSPTSNFGTASSLRIKQSSSENLNTYLKFDVTGLTGAIESAVLRLYVTDASPDGGSVYAVSNNYLGTSTPWTQGGLNWNNAPAMSGTALSSAGAATVGQWVELNVKSAINGNGAYSFGLKNAKSDVVYYSSKEGSNKPELVIVAGSGPAQPTLSINDVTVTEGNAGTINANFTVSLSAPSSQTVTVNYATADGTATGGSDYRAIASTQLTFPPMTTSQSVTVIVNGDVLDEPNETFFVNLSGPTNATIADGQGVGTIVDDDGSGGATFFFNPTSDAYVKSSSATSNFGSLQTLRARQSSSEILTSYLKFAVSGLTGSMQSAKLRLYVTDASSSGGSVYAVSNNYLGTSTAWTQSGLNWNNAPAISGTALSSAGPVSLNTWVELDVTPAISGNGTYSFGLKSNASDVVYYGSRESTKLPELVIVTTSSAP